MAKRFTDTDKWRKPFVKSLQAPYKLLWCYALDDCDHAGIWIPEWDVISMRLGSEYTAESALKNFGKNLVDLGGGYFFLPNFIEFQYGELNPSNRVHKSVIDRLSKFDLDGATKPLTSPLQGVKDKDKDKEQDKDKEKDKGVSKGKGLHEFGQSDINTFEKFEASMQGTDYQYADLKYYFEVVKNWAEGKGARKKDWKATARNFMLSDKRENKLQLKNGQTTKKRRGVNWNV